MPAPHFVLRRNHRPRRNQTPAPERTRNFNSPIPAPGIKNDDLIEEPTHRLEAAREIILFVSNDHRERHASTLCGMKWFRFRRDLRCRRQTRSLRDRSGKAATTSARSSRRMPRHGPMLHPDLPTAPGPPCHALSPTRTPLGTEFPHFTAKRAAFSSSSFSASTPFPTKVRLPK